jgi:hypothetical protein
MLVYKDLRICDTSSGYLIPFGIEIIPPLEVT